MRRTLLVLASVLLVHTACANDAGDGTGITVFAAASLTEAFEEIARAFESRTGTKVALNFAGSATLRLQLEQGAPADVLATADEQTMADAVRAGLAAGPRELARNRLVVAVRAGNPHRISSLADLHAAGLVVVLADESVPAGRYAVEAFAKAGLKAPEGSREQSVRAVLAKVALGEADAGIVYATDVGATGGDAGGRTTGGADDRVEAVDIPPGQAVEAVYRIAPTTRRSHPEAASAFVDEVVGSRGRAVLRAFGFLVGDGSGR